MDRALSVVGRAALGSALWSALWLGRRAVIRRLVVAAVVAVAAAMGVSWAWGFVRPPVEGPVGSAFAFAHILEVTGRWYLGVGAGALAGVAAALRLRVAACAASAVAGVVLVPWFVSFARGPAAGDENAVATGPTAAQLTVYSANLFVGQSDLDALAAEARSLGAGVIVVQELTPPAAERLASLLGPTHPHRVEFASPTAAGMGVYSALPLVDRPGAEPRSPVWLAEGASFPQQRVRVVVGGGEVEVWNIHMPNPATHRGRVTQDAVSRGLARIVESAEAAGVPLVMAGDFNSPLRAAPARRLVAAGMREAHDSAGAGLGATWPRVSRLRFLPGVRIDHVMFGGGFGCRRVGVGADNGSDHRPVWAELVLGPGA